MDDERRRRFIAWSAAKFGILRGSQKRLREETGKHGHDAFSKGYISQLFDKEKSFGEDAARELALRLGLPLDFFLLDDQPLRVTEEGTEYVVKGLSDLLELDPAEHERVVTDLRAIIEGVRASKRLRPRRRPGSEK